MIFAKIEVNGVCAYATQTRIIPSGIIGAKVSFTFMDPKWDNLTKTAVFKGFGTKDVNLEGNTAIIPKEVVSRKGVRLLVGVYGTDADNIIAIPTLWADLGEVRYAADPSGDPSTDPSLPVWAQLEARVKKIEEGGGGGGGNVNITINGEGPDVHGNFVINALNDVEIAQLDATLIGGTNL